MVVGNVDGGGDGRHDGRRTERRRQRRWRRWRQQQGGPDELSAFAVRAADGRGQLHVHGQERGRLQELATPGDRHARHERARGPGAGRDRVRQVRVVHVHHVRVRRDREYLRPIGNPTSNPTSNRS